MHGIKFPHFASEASTLRDRERGGIGNTKFNLTPSTIPTSKYAQFSAILFFLTPHCHSPHLPFIPISHPRSSLIHTHAHLSFSLLPFPHPHCRHFLILTVAIPSFSLPPFPHSHCRDPLNLTPPFPYSHSHPFPFSLSPFAHYSFGSSLILTDSLVIPILPSFSLFPHYYSHSSLIPTATLLSFSVPPFSHSNSRKTPSLVVTAAVFPHSHYRHSLILTPALVSFSLPPFSSSL